MKTRVLVADDHPLALMAIRSVFEADESFEVVAEAQTGLQVLPLVSRTQPDVVVLDLWMPGASGLWVLERLREQHPHVAAIVFSGCDDREQIDLALRLGARGYVLKTLAIANLPAIVRANLAGHLYFAPDGWAEHAQQETIRETGLTEKELDVLAAVAEGLSNREIATRLWLSAETVKTHLSSVYRKLDVNSRVAAARVAYELHLLDPPTQTLAAAR